MNFADFYYEMFKNSKCAIDEKVKIKKGEYVLVSVRRDGIYIKDICKVKKIINKVYYEMENIENLLIQRNEIETILLSSKNKKQQKFFDKLLTYYI